ncbi:MAG: hypothetical protein CVU54_01430 [Deltaproteobacteria bacterium HGW-Deltaproteobacteria-12]|nr:MAG: hypothetical protein CVU54_01430 [Deltaproteobacteria bacterium HGW-Deltaproteobacteria-12]
MIYVDLRNCGSREDLMYKLMNRLAGSLSRYEMDVIIARASSRRINTRLARDQILRIIEDIEGRREWRHNMKYEISIILVLTFRHAN